ncbi:DUF6443 domain-containing protein [Flavobacterium sp. UBA4197]|uniref:DUF6443 domain-containing protein n=1 Tax=Flavobacterium sp. UBA4197 TaxID=1946546 RepID=UPI00257FA4ED|nr:DUF6443 domain-containing protein [Flavobacterium sp. UBA4197]
MKKLILILLLSLPLWMQAQTPSQNYTKKTTYREANAGRPLTEVIYYDGLGRPVQHVASKQSATGKDIITHIEYDKGQQLKDYLPYPATTADMSYQSSAQQATLNYAQYAGQYPFSEKILETSPSARLLKQGAQGADWQINPNSDTDHTVKYEYQTNVAGEVKNYFAITAWDAAQGLYSIQLQDKGNYTPNQLYKTVTKDENWTSGTNNTTEEFKDKEGRVILKRSYNNGAHDTYYVYDLYDNLTYVIPPLVNNPVNQLDDLCYQYRYDHRNRLVEKKLPGKQWEYTVYDKLDRAVATSQMYSPFGTQERGWVITKYDALGRTAYTGWFASNQSRSSLQSQYNSATNNFYEVRLKPGMTTVIDGVGIHYTNLTVPTTGLKLLTVAYYDDYLYPNAPALPSQIEGQNVTTSVVGFPTGSWTRILTNGSETLNEQSYLLYDVKGRNIRTYTTNHLGGYTQVDTKLDFTGKTVYAKTYHKQNGSATLLQLTDSFTYTDQDRLLLHKQQINGGAEQLIVKNTYDELGQLTSKNIGGEDSTGEVGLQKVDYRYNIRGWMTDINNEAPTGSPNFMKSPDDLFGFRINYNEVTESQNGTISKTASSINGKVTPLYNGNIAETFWQSSGDGTIRKYGYEYDNLNRLTGAFYQKPKTLNPIPGSYNELLSYDKNGNITTLKRTGNLDNPVFSIDIDDLTYTYDNGNKLLRVNDITNNPEGFGDNIYGSTIDDYSYDANGNMTKDENKKISSIAYNHLNLPTEINFSAGDKINYIYNAAGVKVRKKVTLSGNTTVSDYLNAFHYENQVLKFFSHPEGYVAVTSGTFFNYVFNYTDHIGNIRLSWAWDDQNEGLKIIEESHYYPFGLKHRAYNTNQYSFVPPVNGVPGYAVPTLEQAGGRTPVNPFKYKYQGQERQEEIGLNWDSFKWRNYDYAIGRFMSIDPLAEDYTYQSTYAFAENKVISHRELEGLEGVWFQNVLNIDKTVNPNGVGAHVMGFTQGLVNSAKGLVNAVAHPVETAKGIGNVALWVAVGSQASGAVDKALGTNSTGAGNALLSGVVSGGNKLVNGNGSERGEVLGEVAGAIVGTKGAGAVSKGVGAIIEGNQTTNVFRVFGGDAKAAGFSWTTENPAQVSNFRDAAGLPSGGASGATNTGQFVLEGTVKNKNIIQTRAALPLDGNKGGLPELIIDPKNVKINRVSGVNPQF